MSNDYYEEPQSRGPVDIAHFVIGFIGFLTATTGIVITTASIFVIGALLFGWAVAYFSVN